MAFQKENKFYVYALGDPVNKVPFYIGKGCGKRAYKHLKCKEGNKEKNRIIQMLYSLGLEPKIHFIAENLDEKTAYDIEYCIIKNSVNYGIKLTNKVGLLMPPSRKNCKMSEESKLKISISTKGIKKSPLKEETKLKISKANKGKIGQNKKNIDNLELLKKLYVEYNYTKEQIRNFFNIGSFSLNRILKENDIKKTKENFADYNRQKLASKI
jgi:hypothetical protein